MHAWRVRLAAVVTVAILVVAGSLPARGQATGRELPMIKRQLSQASELARRVLAGLQEAPTDNSIPLDENLVKNVRETYVLIRAAKAEMGLLKAKQKFPDPLLDLAYQRVEAAQNLARTPVDMSRKTHPEYIEVSTRDLGRAVQLLDQALVMLP